MGESVPEVLSMQENAFGDFCTRDSINARGWNWLHVCICARGSTCARESDPARVCIGVGESTYQEYRNYAES